MTDDRADFIRRHTRVMPVPLVPEIRIHTADDATALWELTEADLATQNLPPPFWAFPWAGGQALARFVLDLPAIVAGRRVLDFASGSGLVGIAAALAGAREVEAVDIDPYAEAAIRLNGVLNRVSLTPRNDDLVGRQGQWDVVFAADIFYERNTAGAVTTWLRELADRRARVFIGDPGRAYLDPSRLERTAAYDVPVPRALEDTDVKRTTVWRVIAA